MRVVINALAVSPERPGGDTTYVRELVRRLPRVGTDDEWCVLVSRRARSLFAPAPANLRYVICDLPGTSLVLRAIWEQTLLPRIVARLNPDVVHAPVNVAPFGVASRVLLTAHEAEPFMPDNRIPLPLLIWWRVVRRVSASRATRVLTVSEAAKADLVRWMKVPADRIHVVHLGVDSQRFSPPASDSATAPIEDKYILWVGRPYPGKNLPRLITAFASLRKSGRPERLVIAGPRGWTDRELRATIRKHSCGEAVMRVGPLEQALPDWYRGATVFAYPSTRESFGLPVLEAMACGTAVVAASIPALREVGGTAAMYADPASPDGLRAALGALLEHPNKRRELQVAGRQQAARFSWDQTAAVTYTHLAQVARG